MLAVPCGATWKLALELPGSGYTAFQRKTLEEVPYPEPCDTRDSKQSLERSRKDEVVEEHLCGVCRLLSEAAAPARRVRETHRTTSTPRKEETMASATLINM